MTVIAYSDCTAASDDGRFMLEAKSPYNGAIRHRDGRRVTRNDPAREFGMFQREFRYQLVERVPRRLDGLRGAGRRVVWERWQPEREESPRELVVADDGWAVIRTHGFAPELVAVAPDGRDVLRVRITRPGRAHRTVGAASVPVFDWVLDNCHDTTAGVYWAMHSRRYFFRYRQAPYFTWRAAWGQRLVLDLERAVAFMDERSLPDGLGAEVDAAECRVALAVLERLSGRMGEVRAVLSRKGSSGEEERLIQDLQQASSSLHLVGVHRLREGIPFLRAWEGIDSPSASMGSRSLSGGWWLETQYFRPVVHHALKLLGEEPRGYPTYHFTNFGDNTGRRFPMPEQLTDRRERARRIAEEMTAADVLQLLGSPDFVSQRVLDMGTREWRAREDWEYDFLEAGGWTTLRLTWEECDEHGYLVGTEQVAPYWLASDEREAEHLWL